MSSPFHRPDEPKAISEVNVVPLADVSLVLLIILLVLSPMMTQSMLKVKTAGRDAAPPPPISEIPEPPPPLEMVLAVAVTPDGYSVGEKTFTTERELKMFLSDELIRRVDKKVFVTPHPDVAHGRVVDALELAKEAGAETVALVQTQEETHGEVRPAQTAP